MQEYLSQLVLESPRRSSLVLYQGLWIEFFDRSGKRWCQPDAILIDEENRIGVVLEVKYQHTPDAWWQLKHLYVPVAQVLFPGVQSWGMVEVCHFHDPLIKFPDHYDFTPTPFSVRSASRVSVHIYNPKREKRRLAAGLGRSTGGEQSDDQSRHP